MNQRPGHRWFAAVFDRLSAASERGFMKDIRRQVNGSATGRTLEIGLGTGLSLPYYRDDVELTAVEPDPYMLKRALEKLNGRDVAIEQAPAEQLPFPDASFDSVVTTLVLCSVDSPRKSLDEIQRVLKPGGRYFFYEHHRYNNYLGGLIQDGVAPLWGWIAGGCQPNRRLQDDIRNAGFAELSMEHSAQLPPVPPMLIVRPHILGWARKAGE